MKTETRLYFVAIVVPEPLSSRIRQMKEELTERFGTKSALNSPAHLTLFPPFRRESAEDSDRILTQTAEKTPAFQLKIRGFGSFPPQVIFLKPLPCSPLSVLHARLNADFAAAGIASPEKAGRDFNPHITLGNRDFTPEGFAEAENDFLNRPFSEDFTAENLALLQHNGRFWESVFSARLC